MNSLQNKYKKLIIIVAIIFCFIAIYEIASYFIDSKFILPKLSLVFSEMISLFGEKIFWKSFAKTILRTLISFTASITIATILVFLSKTKSLFITNGVEYFIKFIRALPTITVTLIIVLWTNYNVAPIFVSAMVILPNLYSGIKSAVENFDRELIEMLNIYKVKKKTIIYIYFREILPKIMLTISSNLSLNLKLTVAGEVLAFTSLSLGGLMNLANLQYETSRLMALTLVTVITAMILESTLNKIIKKAVKYENN